MILTWEFISIITEVLGGTPTLIGICTKLISIFNKRGELTLMTHIFWDSIITNNSKRKGTIHYSGEIIPAVNKYL